MTVFEMDGVFNGLNESGTHNSKTAKIARITPAGTLATLKRCVLTAQMLRSFNEGKQEGVGFYEEALQSMQVSGL